MTLIADRLQQLRTRPHGRALRAYAAKHAAELLAVAVEAFFENPAKLKERDYELYAMLARYFNQDPAISGTECAPGFLDYFVALIGTHTNPLPPAVCYIITFCSFRSEISSQL